jgi:hypothetical protein
MPDHVNIAPVPITSNSARLMAPSTNSHAAVNSTAKVVAVASSSRRGIR